MEDEGEQTTQSAWASLTPKKRKTALTKLLQTIKQHNLKGIELVETSTQRIPGDASAEIDLAVHGSASQAKGEGVEALAQTLQELVGEVYFDVSVCDFDIDEAVPDCSVLGVNGETVSLLAGSQDIPTFLLFWASWSAEAVAAMKRFNTLALAAKQHKARFVAVALDETAEELAKAIKNHSLEGAGVEFFFDTKPAEGECSAVSATLEIPSVPFLMALAPGSVLVDRGDPLDMGLVASQVLKDERLVNATTPQKGNIDWDKIPGAVQKALLKKVRALLEEFDDDVWELNLLVSENKVHKQGRDVQVNGGVVLAGAVPLEKEDWLVKVLDVLEVEGRVADVQRHVMFATDVVPLEATPEGGPCAGCGKPLSDVRWLCVSCPDSFTQCTACLINHQEGGADKGSHRSYHANIRIPHGTSAEVLASAQIMTGHYTVLPSSDRADKPDPETRVHELVNCDQCASAVVGTRWKCAHCADFDLCQACFDSYLKRKEDSIHDPTHAFLQILDSAAVMHSDEYAADDDYGGEGDEGDFDFMGGEGDEFEHEGHSHGGLPCHGHGGGPRIEVVEDGDEEEEGDGGAADHHAHAEEEEEEATEEEEAAGSKKAKKKGKKKAAKKKGKKAAAAAANAQAAVEAFEQAEAMAGAAGGAGFSFDFNFDFRPHEEKKEDTRISLEDIQFTLPETLADSTFAFPDDEGAKKGKKGGKKKGRK